MVSWELAMSATFRSFTSLFYNLTFLAECAPEKKNLILCGILFLNFYFCPPPGPGQVSPYRPVKGRQDIPSDHQEQLREGDVRQGQSEAGAGQGCAAEHEWPGKRQQRGIYINNLRLIYSFFSESFKSYVFKGKSIF